MSDFISQVRGDFTEEQAAALRAYNQNLSEQFRARGGKVEGDFAGAPLLLLTTRGARSGKQHTTPLVYTKDGENYVVIASKAGLETHPAWYYNLVAHPEATLEVETRRFPVRARLTEGQERQRLFEQQAALMPQFHDYARKTTRELPVFLLEP